MIPMRSPSTDRGGKLLDRLRRQRVDGRTKTLTRERDELRSLLVKTRADLNEALAGVDPYVRTALLSIKDMPIDGDDLCFIGPNGCQAHPGWTMRSGDCGKAWVRGWLYRDKPTDPDLLVLFNLLADGESNIARKYLRDALEMLITMRGYDRQGILEAMWKAVA